MSKEMEGKLIEMNGKVDDAIRQLGDATSAKARLAEENLTFGRRIETLEFELSSINTAYTRARGDLEDARLHLESEMAVRRTKKKRFFYLFDFFSSKDKSNITINS
jgi:hypothetical protein